MTIVMDSTIRSRTPGGFLFVWVYSLEVLLRTKSRLTNGLAYLLTHIVEQQCDCSSMQFLQPISS